MTEPIKRNCTTCEFAGFVGEYNTVPTCDAQTEEYDSDRYDAILLAVDDWVKGGEQGPCPHHKAAWWANDDKEGA